MSNQHQPEQEGSSIMSNTMFLGPRAKPQDLIYHCLKCLTVKLQSRAAHQQQLTTVEEALHSESEKRLPRFIRKSHAILTLSMSRPNETSLVSKPPIS